MLTLAFAAASAAARTGLALALVLPVSAAAAIKALLLLLVERRVRLLALDSAKLGSGGLLRLLATRALFPVENDGTTDLSEVEALDLVDLAVGLGDVLHRRRELCEEDHRADVLGEPAVLDGELVEMDLELVEHVDRVDVDGDRKRQGLLELRVDSGDTRLAVLLLEVVPSVLGAALRLHSVTDGLVDTKKDEAKRTLVMLFEVSDSPDLLGGRSLASDRSSVGEDVLERLGHEVGLHVEGPGSVVATGEGRDETSDVRGRHDDDREARSVKRETVSITL